MKFNENKCTCIEILWKWMYFYWNLLKINVFLMKFDENECIEIYWKIIVFYVKFSENEWFLLKFNENDSILN